MSPSRIQVTQQARTVARALHEALRSLPSGQVFTLWDGLLGVSLFITEFSKTMARDLTEDEDLPLALRKEEAIIHSIESIAQAMLVSESQLRKLLKAIHEGEQHELESGI